jgi:hypothetical protein
MTDGKLLTKLEKELLVSAHGIKHLAVAPRSIPFMLQSDSQSFVDAYFSVQPYSMRIRFESRIFISLPTDRVDGATVVTSSSTSQPEAEFAENPRTFIRARRNRAHFVMKRGALLQVLRFASQAVLIHIY